MNKKIFYTLLFLLPVNLGKHFVFKFSYVNGLLIDYLIPTLYLQDILVAFYLVWWFIKDRKKPLISYKNSWLVRILFLLCLSLLLSTFVSTNFYVSSFNLIRFYIYIAFALVLPLSIDLRKEWVTIIKVLLLSILSLEILSIAQWFKQGSVFNNYLYFGEQPYSFSTFGISKESFFGKTVIPPYGTFRHPNVLAGYLSITLFWLYVSLQKISSNLFKFFILLALVLGMFVLVVTSSITAWIALLSALILYHTILIFNYKQHKPRLWKLLYLVLVVFFIGISANLSWLSQSFFSENPSFYRRADLYQIASKNIKTYFAFGSGFGSSTKLSATNFTYFDEIKYPQPIHNIYLLMFLEGGIFTLIFYLGLFMLLMYPANKKNILFLLSFFQFFTLGLFDHYILTMQQMNLLFWLTLSFYLAYNYSSS